MSAAETIQAACFRASSSGAIYSAFLTGRRIDA